MPSSDDKSVVVISNTGLSGAPLVALESCKELSKKSSVILCAGTKGDLHDTFLEYVEEIRYYENLKNSFSIFRIFSALLFVRNLLVEIKPMRCISHSTIPGVVCRPLSFLYQKIEFYHFMHGWGWRGMPALKRAVVMCVELGILVLFSKVKYLFVDLNSYKFIGGFAGFTKRYRNFYLLHNRCRYETSEIEPRINDKVLKVGMLARLDEAKNHRGLIKACIAVGGIDLFLQGQGVSQFEPEAEEFYKQTGRQLLLLDESSDVSLFYHQIDVFALISNFEAYPLVLLESMAFQKFIIASDVGGIREIITSDKLGLLVNNHEELCDALIRVKAIVSDSGSEFRKLYLANLSANFCSFHQKIIFKEHDPR